MRQEDLVAVRLAAKVGAVGFALCVGGYLVINAQRQANEQRAEAQRNGVDENLVGENPDLRLLAVPVDVGGDAATAAVAAAAAANPTFLFGSKSGVLAFPHPAPVLANSATFLPSSKALSPESMRLTIELPQQP